MSKSLAHLRAVAGELIVLTHAELEAFAENVVAKARPGRDLGTPAVADTAAIMVTGPLTVSVETYEAHISGCRLALKPREFALLNALAQNAGKVLTRQRILELAWPNCERLDCERTVDVHIRRLRLNLGKNSSLIETIRGVGYKLLKLPPANGDGA